MNEPELRSWLAETLSGDAESAPAGPGDTIGGPHPSADESQTATQVTGLIPTLSESGHGTAIVGADDHGPEGIGWIGDALTVTASDYLLAREIGRGGMGIVMQARQANLDRDVAVKLIKPWLAHQPRFKRAFLAEAFLTGFLDHPNIIPVHELIQTDDGQVGFAMKMVGGQRWRDLLHEEHRKAEGGASAFDLKHNIEIMLRVADAVAFAHSRGVIHRDLKPENVMIGEFGEVILMDWGLAVSFDVESSGATGELPLPTTASITHPGGTPRYMAPEMTTGKGSELGPWTDVYLLGAILHEILTGDAPHAGDSVMAVMLAARESTPPIFEDTVPDEIQEICRKAMAREPLNRHATIKEFQRALRDYLNHRESRLIAREASRKLHDCVGERLTRRLSESGGRRKVYQDLSEVIAGFRQAIMLWSGNAEASQNLGAARMAFAELATKAGDFSLAHMQIATLEGDRVERLEARIRAAAKKRRHHQSTTTWQRRGLAVASLIIITILVIGYLTIADAKKGAEDNAERARAAESAARTESRQKDDVVSMLQDEKQGANRVVVELREQQRRLDETLGSLLKEQDRSKGLLEVANQNAADARESAKRARQAEDDLRLESDAKSGLVAELERQVRRSNELASEAGANRLRARESEIEKQRLASDRDRLADIGKLVELEARSDELLDRYRNDEPRVLLWLDEAGELVAGLASYQRELTDFENGDSAEAKARIPVLQAFTSRLRRFFLGRFKSVQSRADWLARRKQFHRETSQELDSAWSEAITAIGKSRIYGRLAISPQKGLIPLGADRNSKRHEFLHLLSHEDRIPARDRKGKIPFDSNTGIILVLIPGCEFTMGSQSSSKRDANFDPASRTEESPVTTVSLAPYFISKYELTRAQWERINSHRFGRTPGSKPDDAQVLPAVPSWRDAQRELSDVGLRIPTEAQWECAARAGTDGIWPVGDDFKQLRGFANLRDKSLGSVPRMDAFPWDDGFRDLAPVHELRPNRFGLHQTIGNVCEHCREAFGAYPANPNELAADGERSSRGTSRIYRGGDRGADLEHSRVARRSSADEKVSYSNVGVRPSRGLDD